MLIALIRGLSVRAELAIVVIGAFGYFILGTILLPFAHAPPVITDAHLRFLLVYEPMVLAALLPFLHIRGWTLQRMGLVPRLREILVGLALSVVGYLAVAAMWLLVWNLLPEVVEAAQNSTLVAANFDFSTVVLASLVNPVFEEIFLCGYLISAISTRRSLSTAVNVSVAIRVFYHFYQGVVGVITVVPIGLLFAWWFARSRNLWAIIVAHMVFDLLGLAAYVR
jgi:uncharacterized protein